MSATKRLFGLTDFLPSIPARPVLRKVHMSILQIAALLATRQVVPKPGRPLAQVIISQAQPIMSRSELGPCNRSPQGLLGVLNPVEAFTRPTTKNYLTALTLRKTQVTEHLNGLSQRKPCQNQRSHLDMLMVSCATEESTVTRDSQAACSSPWLFSLPPRPCFTTRQDLRTLRYLAQALDRGSGDVRGFRFTCCRSLLPPGAAPASNVWSRSGAPFALGALLPPYHGGKLRTTQRQRRLNYPAFHLRAESVLRTWLGG